TQDTSHLDVTRDFGIAKAASLIEKQSAKLLKLPGVIGHAIGTDDHDQSPFIYILVESAAHASASTLPKEVEGLPVKIMEVGTIVAY
ncbi:MAG: hypothetical protein LLF94_11035, partial [Chlamydiales bacterium]|nr:hypothetical protein [Chlamydiales bacterium]